MAMGRLRMPEGFVITEHLKFRLFAGNINEDQISYIRIGTIQIRQCDASIFNVIVTFFKPTIVRTTRDIDPLISTKGNVALVIRD
jgi:hypothetical protein